MNSKLVIPKPFSEPGKSHEAEQSKTPWRSNTAILSSDGGIFSDPTILSSCKIYRSSVTTR